MFLRLGALCEFATVDAQRRASLINIFNIFPANSFPWELNRFFVVASIQAEEEDERRTYQLEFTFRTPSGDVVAKIPSPARLESNPVSDLLPPDASIVIELAGAKAPEPGRYTIEITSEGVRIGEILFAVLQAGAPE